MKEIHLINDTSFFRVLLSDFKQRLTIPRAFVRHITKEKSDGKATLVNPNGGSWRVDVYRDDGEQAMQFGGDGWVQLVRAHKLELGYFLVFYYKDNMVFDFRGYDLSTCEITYPSITQEGGGGGGRKKSKKREVIVIEDSVDQPQLKGEVDVGEFEESKENNNSSSPLKKMKCEEIQPPIDSTCNKVRLPIERKCKEIRPTVERRILAERKCKEIRPPIERKCKEITRPLRKRNCKEIQPPNVKKCEDIRFEGTISSYNLNHPYMYIPLSVVRQWTAVKRTKRLILKDPKGRLWPVDLFHRKKIFKSGSGIHISNGWLQFACENKLMVGDLCVFELVSRGSKKGLDVHIIRCSQ